MFIKEPQLAASPLEKGGAFPDIGPPGGMDEDIEEIEPERGIIRGILQVAQDTPLEFIDRDHGRFT